MLDLQRISVSKIAADSLLCESPISFFGRWLFLLCCNTAFRRLSRPIGAAEPAPYQKPCNARLLVLFSNIGAPKRAGPVRWKMAQPALCRPRSLPERCRRLVCAVAIYIFVAGRDGRYIARGRRVPLPARAAGDAKRRTDGGPPDAFANGCSGGIGLPRCRAGKRPEAGAAHTRQKGAYARLYRPAPSLCAARRLAEGKTRPEARRSPLRDAAAVRRRIPVRACVPYRLYCSLTSEAAAFRADERRCRESRGRREATRNSGRSLRPARRRRFGERKNTSAVRLSAGGAIPSDGAAEKPVRRAVFARERTHSSLL